MELWEAIRNRRSIRKFLAEPVYEADLQEIVEAGTLAANAENGQMWRFVAVTNTGIIQKIGQAVLNRIDSIVNAGRTMGLGEEFDRHKYFMLFFREAPAIIAVFACTFDSAVERALQPLNMSLKIPVPIDPNQQSIGAAVQNMALVAHAKGYGSTCMYAPVLAYREIGEILEVTEPWALAALIPVGRPAQSPKARPRKPLSEVYTLIK